MTAYTQSEIVKAAATTATVTIQPGRSGLDWIVWQMTVTSIPRRGGGQVTVNRDGIYLTSTIIIPSSAQGPPAIVLHDSSVLESAFTGMVAGDECIVTLLYEEVPWGEHGTSFGLV